MLKLQVYVSFLLIIDVVVCKPDYIYYHKVDGWLKLHPIPATWEDAYKTCQNEGSVLASPINPELATELHNIIRESNLDSALFLGTTALTPGVFTSIEGVPLADLSITWGAYVNGQKRGNCLSLSTTGKTYITSCSELLPYICYKKIDETTIYNNQCGTFDNDYRLNITTGSCYKYHKDPKSWWEAHRICNVEGAHLVVINGRDEADVVTGFMAKSSSNMNWNYATYVGLIDRSKDHSFVTLRGEKVESVYNRWAPGQPDNKGIHLCGIIYPEGTLDDVNCGTAKMKFVCEKDPNASRFQYTNVMIPKFNN